MYKVCIMISIFQGMPRKIPGSYTLVAGFLICQYTFQYTSCILCVTGGILGGTWKVCIWNFTLVAGFLMCQYTFQYTSCILCVTGGILGGMWKVCIRNFTVVVGFLLVQATCQYTVCILGKSRGILNVVRGILNVVWKESGLILYTVYLVNNDPWFSVGMKFVFRTNSNRVFRNTNIRFENAL